jgi:hypothetical protein
MSVAIAGSAGVGSMLCAFLPGSSGVRADSAYARLLQKLRSALPEHGSAMVLRCPPAVKKHLDPWGPSPTDLQCMRAVKRALDEKDILNRGRYLF